MPEVFHTDIFINADLIAAQMNPKNPEAAAIAAGRQMLLEIEEKLSAKETFAIETTLSSKGYLQLVKRAQLIGYEVVLYLFYLPSHKLALTRVAERVKKGGHNILPETIKRRYEAGILMLKYYLDLVDEWFVYHNEESPPTLIAEGSRANKIKITNFEIWKQLANN